MPLVGPSPLSIASSKLIDKTTLESLMVLPEIQTSLDVLDGSSASVGERSIDEAITNTKRAGEILLGSMPDMYRATLLLEADLQALCGRYSLANAMLLRHSRHGGSDIGTDVKTSLQFIQAKMHLNVGEFSYALSEFEDIFEVIERNVERQTRQMERSNGDTNEEPVSVIRAAAALTGVGLSKLLMLSNTNDYEVSFSSECMEALEAATEILIEARSGALESREHVSAAVNLGVAASISLTNLGAAHLIKDEKDHNLAIDCWTKALETLDTILPNAMTSAVVSMHKFQIMEGIRARAHCNIAWAMLGIDAGNKARDDLSEDQLKEATRHAKLALDVYDELINGSKRLRGEAPTDPDDNSGRDSEEWEQVFADHTSEMSPESASIALSPHWKLYHRAESARALGLLAQCYAANGMAVTAEGLFQSALDASLTNPFGASVMQRQEGKGEMHQMSSPSIGLVARDVRLWYAALCSSWDGKSRKGDALRLRDEAESIQRWIYPSALKEGKINSLDASLWPFSPQDLDDK